MNTCQAGMFRYCTPTNASNRSTVNDLLDSTTLAQPKGFGPGFSSYAYDGNGKPATAARA